MMQPGDIRISTIDEDPEDLAEGDVVLCKGDKIIILTVRPYGKGIVYYEATVSLWGRTFRADVSWLERFTVPEPTSSCEGK